jgi:hypothetical protein
MPALIIRPILVSNLLKLLFTSFSPAEEDNKFDRLPSAKDKNPKTGERMMTIFSISKQACSNSYIFMRCLQTFHDKNQEKNSKNSCAGPAGFAPVTNGSRYFYVF